MYVCVYHVTNIVYIILYIFDLIWENMHVLLTNYEWMVMYMWLLHSHFVQYVYQIWYPNTLMIGLLDNEIIKHPLLNGCTATT